MPTASKLGPSFVCSVCSCDMVRIMSGHSQGSSLAGFFTSSNVHSLFMAILHFKSSHLHKRPRSTILHFHVVQNLLQTCFTSEMSWLLQLDSHKRQHSQSSNRFAFSNSELHTPSTTFLSSTITPKQSRWQLFLVCHLQWLHVGFLQLN